MRKILHIDMDAFYAAVEQRNNPELRGRPVIVGGDPEKRGVVSTCSYEARRFGIHSAMASRRAKALCPRAVFVRPHFEEYRQVSAAVREIFFRYTDKVEPLSLDEAYLDVSENLRKLPSATETARRIKADIYRETALTASAGVSYNKFLAKVASDYNKPDGLTVIRPEEAIAFLEKLDIGSFFGVGRVTREKMHEMGIKTGADLKAWREDELRAAFGKAGSHFYHIVRGYDPRPVESVRERKSLGKELTLDEDTSSMESLLELLKNLSSRVSELLKREELAGKTVTVKVKYGDFQQVTRSLSTDLPLQEAGKLFALGKLLLKKTEAGRRAVRLLGITVSGFEESGEGEQLMLPFWEEEDREAAGHA